MRAHLFAFLGAAAAASRLDLAARAKCPPAVDPAAAARRDNATLDWCRRAHRIAKVVPGKSWGSLGKVAGGVAFWNNNDCDAAVASCTGT